jgi:cytochrome c553
MPSVAQGQLIAVGGGPGGAGAACFSCHGLQGQGDAGAAFPRLAGLDARYLAKQMDDYVSGARSDAVMIPISRQLAQADRPGIFRGQCAEYCGAQHAHMAFDVIVTSGAAFDAWLAGLARPAREPGTPERCEGRELFVNLGCGACHAVRGVAEGWLGPDLAQVGGRRSLAAGTVKNGIGNLAGWIASAQHLKPGNRLPSYDQLEGRQLRALAAYLESLKSLPQTTRSGPTYSPGLNTDIWILGLSFVAISAVAAAVDIIVGVLKTRAPGMPLANMRSSPGTCWSPGA